MLSNRREFISAFAGLLLLPNSLLSLSPESQDRDLEKILREIPNSRPNIDRMKLLCEQYASIFPVPLVLAAKIQAIESGYNPDAISDSYAVGGAQFVHNTARDLGAHLPPAEKFKSQDDVLVLRRRSQAKLDEAIATFRKGKDRQAADFRTEARELTSKYEKLHERTMADFKKRMFAMSTEARRAYDERFDPATTDGMLVQYLATLARTVKKEFDLVDDAHILLLAGVAFNAGPGSVKRKPGIPTVAQNVEYANKLMLFQKVKL
jgi:hypothetical protein